MKLSDITEKKFEEFFEISDWEIETDTGWEDIKGIGKTIPYQVWFLKTWGFELECADNHIVFDEQFNELYVYELKVGDKIMTEFGPQEVLKIEKTNEIIEMYDVQVSSDNHRYYTNGILSHNSIFLANLAANAVKLGYNSAVVSLEMADRKVVKRLGANLLNVTMGEYAQIAEDQDLIRKKLATIGMENFKQPGQLFVKEFPTSAASIKDVERWLLKMEQMKGIKFKTVFIDYINILANWRNPNSENTYMKVKQIAEDMRAMAIRNNWAIISLTQTNRGAFNTSSMSITDIAESSGLGATVDAMFGIVQDEIMHANNEYFLQTLLNRDEGYKNSRKRLTINYSHMRLEETLDDIITDVY